MDDEMMHLRLIMGLCSSPSPESSNTCPQLTPTTSAPADGSYIIYNRALSLSGEKMPITLGNDVQKLLTMQKLGSGMLRGRTRCSLCRHSPSNLQNVNETAYDRTMSVLLG